MTFGSSGSFTVNPVSNTQYKIVCTNPGTNGFGTGFATVMVNGGFTPPPTSTTNTTGVPGTLQQINMADKNYANVLSSIKNLLLELSKQLH
jgi:hypothetical protein